MSFLILKFLNQKGSPAEIAETKVKGEREARLPRIEEEKKERIFQQQGDVTETSKSNEEEEMRPVPYQEEGENAVNPNSEVLARLDQLRCGSSSS
jgi:hypothetical protein